MKKSIAFRGRERVTFMISIARREFDSPQAQPILFRCVWSSPLNARDRRVSSAITTPEVDDSCISSRLHTASNNRKICCTFLLSFASTKFATLARSGWLYCGVQTPAAKRATFSAPLSVWFVLPGSMLQHASHYVLLRMHSSSTRRTHLSIAGTP